MKKILTTLMAASAVTFSAPLVAAPVLPQTAIYNAVAEGTADGSAIPVFTGPINGGQFANLVMSPGGAGALSEPGTLLSIADGGSTTANYLYSATSSFTGNYVNGAVGSDYALNFHIGSGYLYAGLMNTLVPGAFNQNTWASYSLDIRLNGSSIWTSNLKLESQICAAGGFCSLYSMYGGAHPLGATTTQGTPFGSIVIPAGTFDPSGFQIPGSAPSDQYAAFYGYSWNDQDLSLDLGTMNPLEAFSLEYVMTAKVYGNTDGVGISRAGARIADPFGVNGGFDLIATPLATVPEPPMLALLGLSLVGLAASLRRKQREFEVPGSN